MTPGAHSPPFTSLVGRCADACRVHADRAAFRDDTGTWTYRDLDDRANRIAAAVTGDQPVIAVLMKTGAWAAAAMLGVLKAGKTVLPLDPDWPETTLSSILRHAGANALITSSAHRMTVTACMPDQAPIWIAEECTAALADAMHGTASPDDAAVIYYTSGSTGTPKGVVISHRSLAHNVTEYIRALDIRPDDRCAWIFSAAFGASTGPLFGALCTGACVAPIDVRSIGLNEVVRRLEDERVTTLHCATSYFRLLARSLNGSRNALPDLRVIKIGAETVGSDDVRRFREQFGPDTRLINGLGITEAGGNIAYMELDRGTAIDEPVAPVGHPIPGVELLISDGNGHLAVSDAEGELVVRSPYLASGYWRDPAQTRAAFRTLPGSDRPVLFTGDFCRLSADGCLTHLGRMDRQVKIRGHRVSPEAVESAISQLPSIRTCVVTPRMRQGAWQLVAHVELESGETLDPIRIREFLRSLLPDYMIPARIVARNALPRLPGGKPDLNALMQVEEAEHREPVTTPVSRDDATQRLIAIWERVIGVKNPSVTDHFFDSGGDSHGALLLCLEIERAFGIDLPLGILIGHPTIEKLAAVISAPGDERQLSGVICIANGDGARPPFFCIPGAGSDALSLREVAQAVDRDQPFYALPYPALLRDDIAPRTVEAIADYYIPLIRSVQPKGPYYLGGGSFGGVVAYEMARRLRDAGEQVALIVMLDTYGPGYPRLRRDLSLRRRGLVLARWLLPIGQKEELSWINFRAGMKERVYRFLAWIRQCIPGGKPPASRFLRYHWVREIAFRASARYAYPPANGPVDLFRAEEQPPDILYRTDPTLGWSKPVGDDLRIHDVPGRHGRLVRGANAPVLARTLQDALDRAFALARDTDDPREIWNQLAYWWDRRAGDTGMEISRRVILPVMKPWLEPLAGRHILDVACGNGWLSRRLAGRGARVTAFDFSRALIDRARQRTPVGADILYRVLDAAKINELRALDRQAFDAAVCNMGLMDMQDIAPLFAALKELLKPGSRFVFSMLRIEGDAPDRIRAYEDQPIPHRYFHHPDAEWLGLAERYGFTVEFREDIQPTPSNPALLVVSLKRTT